MILRIHVGASLQQQPHAICVTRRAPRINAVDPSCARVVYKNSIVVAVAAANLTLRVESQCVE